MNILIETTRIFGFRGLNNVEIDLQPTTVLTGINNSGKTSFLKALQIVFGNSQFITHDDFYITDARKANKIIIDVKIIPINPDGTQKSVFDEDWEILFTEERIRNDVEDNQFIPLRTTVVLDAIKNTYKTTHYIQQEWVSFQSAEGLFWHQTPNGTEKPFHYDEIPFFYIDAQRDIIEDMKARSSYLGKMLSNIQYSAEDIASIEGQIATLNEQAVRSSDILTNIETTLKELDTAMDNRNHGVDITPFPKKVRDLNKGVSIQYSDFSMDYHGMGTRSWSSLLTLKSFISIFDKNSRESASPFFPIVAIEEPEAHLHPNAQKKLFSQIAGIPGQKNISTHSTYIAASADLKQIRSFYKEGQFVKCGYIDTAAFSDEEKRKINRQVINTRGELFFSKAIIFFEGETEEQALPIFADQYFRRPSVETGIDFVGVGGYGNYLPFIRFTESLNIPWFIFSDAEPNVKASVIKQLADSNTRKAEADCIVFVQDGNDFEKQLLDDGFEAEVKNAIKKIELPKCANARHAEAKTLEIDRYTHDEIYRIMTGAKTQYGPATAYAINEANRGLPPKIAELFDMINAMLTH